MERGIYTIAESIMTVSVIFECACVKLLISTSGLKSSFGDFSIFTARRSYASAALEVVILSVCPSVCHTRAL